MTRFVLAFVLLLTLGSWNQRLAAELLAGVAKADISNKSVIPQHDPLYVKVLILKSESTIAVLITLDAVAVGELGAISNEYLPKLREKLQTQYAIPANNVIVNASHCHGIVRPDVEAPTLAAVKEAMGKLVPVKVGVGVGHEDRISENRRLKLKNGHEADVRHAYALPADEDVAAVGPIDPQIGILKLDRLDGRTLAVVYNFACHPIMGINGDGNTADLVGYASQVIESNLSEGTMALFVQGCGGDINPIRYKDVNQPRHAEPLGQKLGLSVLRAVRAIRCTADAPLRIRRDRLDLPRADHTSRIDALTLEQTRLVKSLRGTTLNFKTFLELLQKHNLAKDFPSYDAQLYLTENALGRNELQKLDDANRKNVQAYLDNIRTMEQLTRVQINLALLQKHQATNRAAGGRPLTVDVMGLRVGEFFLVTFPGELTVEIGLNIKKVAPSRTTFVAGYTNGYIYYTPTAKQLRNRGAAQEDCDTLVAPEWEERFHAQVKTLLRQLQ